MLPTAPETSVPGLSFAPTVSNMPNLRTAGGGGQGGGNQNNIPLQEAIRMLSLRLPRVVGGGSPIPQGLLSAPGLSGAPSGLTELLKMLFGQFNLAGPTSGASPANTLYPGGSQTFQEQGPYGSPLPQTSGATLQPLSSPMTSTYTAPTSTYTAPTSTYQAPISTASPTPTYSYPSPNITPGSQSPTGPQTPVYDQPIDTSGTATTDTSQPATTDYQPYYDQYTNMINNMIYGTGLTGNYSA